MPMVPMYQGGVPSVVDSGQTGRQVAQLPNQTINYAKLMQDAQQPLQDFANNAGKALQTIAARNIKSESDEAEVKYMEAVQSRLYDPESGYFNQKGKNAVDAYDGAMQGLKKDADDILGSLSPWAREAVQSRIQDRLRSAQGQSMQWMSRQRDAWHIGTSKARIDAIVESIGQNYGNKDYCGASYQSLDDEITALAKMQGLGEEQTKALREGYWDMAQAQRYSTWGQDDAVAALTDFQQNRGSIGSDVAAKIGTQLWQQAKQPLAMMLAGSVGETMLNKKDFIKESLKPGHRTGIPAIDGLNQAQKVELFSAAYSYAAQNRAAAQADLRTAVQNSVRTAADQGYDENELSEEDFVGAFGEKAGKERYADYKAAFDTNTAVYTYQFMDNEQIQHDLANAKPVPGSPSYADDRKLYDARVKAAQEIVKLRAADPVGAAIATKQFGYEPLNFEAPDKMMAQLGERVAQAESVARDWGGAPRILSKDEASQLVSSLQGMPIESQVDYLSRIARTVGSAGIRMVADQLKDTDRKYAIAMAGLDIPVGDGGKTAGEFYLKGLQLLADKMVKEDVTPETGDRARINEALQDSSDGKVKGLFDGSPDALASTAELARGNLLYMRWSGQNTDANDAVAAAVGGRVVTHAQQKTILPKGVDSTGVFDDLLAEQAAVIRKMKGVFYIPGSGLPGTPEEIARRLPQIDVKAESVNPDGSVTYSLVYNGSPVFNADRQKYTFDLVKPPKDESRPFYQWANGGLAIEGLDSEDKE